MPVSASRRVSDLPFATTNRLKLVVLSAVISCFLSFLFLFTSCDSFRWNILLATSSVELDILDKLEQLSSNSFISLTAWRWALGGFKTKSFFV